jgi:hypothetical protein
MGVMPVGDGGPDEPIFSAVDFECVGARSSPKDIEVMESSLMARRGEPGLMGGASMVGTTFSAVAVGASGAVVICFGRFDLEKPCAS